MSYRIQAGDTLSALARKNATTVAALMKANPQIKDANLIFTGATLNIPGKSDSFEPSPAPAHTHPTPAGSTGTATTPAALRAYGNGRIPSSALTPIGIGNHRLYAPAADAFKRMRAAAASQGVQIGVTDSYRPYDVQVDLARRKGLYQNGGLAAVPGTSQHGWGMAVDVDTNSRGTQWLRENAARFGFSTIPREPWHWQFAG